MTTPATAPTASVSSAADAPRPLRPSALDRLHQFGRAPRIMGIDVARGLAVFGMIGAHVGTMGELDWGDPASWINLVQGRSAILFALVAGISVALMSGRTKRPTGEALRTARLRMAGRAIVILLFGVALELLGTPVLIILSVYGVLFLLIIPFMGMRRRTLVITAVAMALAGPFFVKLLQALALGSWGHGLSFLMNDFYPVTVWLPLMLAGLALGRSDLRPTQMGVALLLGGIALAVTGYTVGNLVNQGIGGMQEGVPVSEFEYEPGSVAVGSSAAWGDDPSAAEASADAVGKSGDEGTGSAFGSYSDSGSYSATGSYDGSDSYDDSGSSSMDEFAESFDGVGAGDNYLDLLASSDWTTEVLQAAAGVASHSGGTFETFGSGGFALAVLGACLLLAKPLRWALIPVAAVGTMPLTAYSVHIVSVAMLVWPFALAPELDGWKAAVADGQGVWIASILILMLVCTAWAVFVGRGPLERLVARAAKLTNGEDVHQRNR